MKKVVLTRHAVSRLPECQWTIKQAIEAYRDGILEKKYWKEDKQKEGEPRHFVRNGTVIFIVVDSTDKMTGEPIDLIITIVNQLVVFHNGRRN